eukprot:13698926-Alexandrium_andersonii.AAC.1
MQFRAEPAGPAFCTTHVGNHLVVSFVCWIAAYGSASVGGILLAYTVGYLGVSSFVYGCYVHLLLDFLSRDG